MDGSERVRLVEKYSHQFEFDESALYNLMMVVSDKDQFRRCFRLLLEGFYLAEVVSMVIDNKI